MDNDDYMSEHQWWVVTPWVYSVSSGGYRDDDPIKVAARSKMDAMGLAYCLWVREQESRGCSTVYWQASSAEPVL